MVGDRLLGWARENRPLSDRENINLVPLVELTLEFCRFVYTYVHNGDGPSADYDVRAALFELQNEGDARRIDGQLPGGGAHEITTESVATLQPERAAYELLASIVRHYGLAERHIPYADREGRMLSVDQIARIGS